MTGRQLFAHGFTIDDLVDTYSQLAPVLLPHLRHRPVSLKRFPDDIFGESFWEKDAPGFTPAWVKTLPVPRKGGGDPIRYISIPDARTLRWAASVGCVEIHPFLHKYPYIESPTAVVFDLDPGEGLNVTDCCSVALRIRAWFENYGMQTFAKVSGSKGLQLYVPLNTPASYAITQALAHLVAQQLESADPKHITSQMERAGRRGRIFIDWGQNADYKTTVCVYSVRANRPVPFVSTPLTWDEVDRAASNNDADEVQFRPDAAIARVKAFGDIFAPVLSVQQHIPDELLQSLSLPRPGPLRAVKIPALPPTRPDLPRSSDQGGRRVFVIHHPDSKTYELSIQQSEAFRSFRFARIPAKPKAITDATEVPSQSLTEQSATWETAWDLGTFDLVEGNLTKGAALLYLTGRRLCGEWLLQQVENGWKFMNVSGVQNRTTAPADSPPKRPPKPPRNAAPKARARKASRTR